MKFCDDVFSEVFNINNSIFIRITLNLQMFAKYVISSISRKFLTNRDVKEHLSDHPPFPLISAALQTSSSCFRPPLLPQPTPSRARVSGRVRSSPLTFEQRRCVPGTTVLSRKRFSHRLAHFLQGKNIKG